MVDEMWYFSQMGRNEQIHKSIKQIEIVKAHKSVCVIANVMKLCQKRHSIANSYEAKSS